MAITIPTIDEFTESTVMLVIREIAEYICGDNGLVAQINNNDITGFTSSYTNNILKIDATKGDGSTIPVCNVTIEGGGSSTGNPYPTGVSGTVGSDGNITFTITMSSGSPLTTTINMNYFASTADLSDLQEQVTGLALTSSGNTMSINGTSASIVNSISGEVVNGNLKLTINGVTGSDIPLPETGEIPVEVYMDAVTISRISVNEINLTGSASWNNICVIGDTFGGGCIIGFSRQFVMDFGETSIKSSLIKYTNTQSSIRSIYNISGSDLFYKYELQDMDNLVTSKISDVISKIETMNLSNGTYDIGIFPISGGSNLFKNIYLRRFNVNDGVVTDNGNGRFGDSTSINNNFWLSFNRIAYLIVSDFIIKVSL